jgi:hypothetical protein
MVTVSNLPETISSLIDPEIAKDWQEFMSFVKNFRAHVFLGGVVITGIGIFTSIYSILNLEKNKILVPVAIAGVATTILGTGIVVDMASHLYYG